MCVSNRQLDTSVWSLKGKSRLKIGKCRNGINMGMDKIAWETVINANQRPGPRPEEHPI